MTITNEQVEAACVAWADFHDGNRIATHAAMRSALEAAEAARKVPAGFVWVPREPTDAMVVAACKEQSYALGYRAMIAAAPSSAEQAGKVCMESNFPETDSWARRQFLAAPSAPAADERARFEAAMQATHLVVKVDRNEDGRYINSALNYALDGWKLARAQSSAAPATPPADARDGEDARRYRWLRERDVWTTAYGGVRWHMELRQSPDTKELPFITENYGRHLDAAIDRAMGGE
jgi:hypothetical protein